MKCMHPVDDHWGVWCGGSGDHHVAMLIALVTGGYHSCSKYQWYMDGVVIEDETYPVYYATRRGTYACTCKTTDLVIIELKFEVKEGIKPPVNRGQ